MTELTVPRDADQETAAELVQNHVAVGDVVEIWERERTDGDDPQHRGEVTGIEPGYIELEGQPAEGAGIRYDEIDTVIRAQTADDR